MITPFTTHSDDCIVRSIANLNSAISILQAVSVPPADYAIIFQLNVFFFTPFYINDLVGVICLSLLI
jgi:hypothetical protein